jgi:hypothetical protein
MAQRDEGSYRGRPVFRLKQAMSIHTRNESV